MQPLSHIKGNRALLIQSRLQKVGLHCKRGYQPAQDSIRTHTILHAGPAILHAQPAPLVISRETLSRLPVYATSPPISSTHVTSLHLEALARMLFPMALASLSFH